MSKITTRLRKWLAMGNTISYQRKPDPQMSTMTDEQWRKAMNRGKKSNYKVPETPKNSGIGWGP